MCRFLAYRGDPIFLEELICQPRHSLVRQSLRSEEAKTVTNGDGFGIGWYGDRPNPAVYREVMPAWSDENLLALCATVRARVFFAHVRAATGTAITRDNCHPFRHDKYLFMHNGQIGGYPRLRRTLESLLPDHLYAARRGATDSELLFLLSIARIEAGEDPQDAVRGVFESTVDRMREAGIDEPLRFSAALSDGTRLYAFRLASDGQPPTLYLRNDDSGTVIASEPLADCARPWQALPVGAVVRVTASECRISTTEALAEPA